MSAILVALAIALLLFAGLVALAYLGARAAYRRQALDDAKQAAMWARRPAAQTAAEAPPRPRQPPYPGIFPLAERASGAARRVGTRRRESVSRGR